MKTKSLLSPDYVAFVADLKSRITSARLGAARAVNRELILLYWDIGRGIVEKQKTLGWGDAVVEKQAADLRAAFPDIRGFSLANLWRMRQLYETCSSPEFLAQLVREIQKSGGKLLTHSATELKGVDRSAAALHQAVPEILRDSISERISYWDLLLHHCGLEHRERP